MRVSFGGDERGKREDEADSLLSLAGYFIPKGTSILANHWAIHLDPVRRFFSSRSALFGAVADPPSLPPFPSSSLALHSISNSLSVLTSTSVAHRSRSQEVYPEPETFKPERFIDEDGKLIGTKYSERGHHAYGFGRRSVQASHPLPTTRAYREAHRPTCASELTPNSSLLQHLPRHAHRRPVRRTSTPYIPSPTDLCSPNSSLFIVFTRLLWSLNLTNAKDASGVDIPVDVNAYSEGFSSHPLHFECKIEKRGGWVTSAVESTMEAAGIDKPE
jgi:hypothetical protein